MIREEPVDDDESESQVREHAWCTPVDVQAVVGAGGCCGSPDEQEPSDDEGDCSTIHIGIVVGGGGLS